MLTVSKCLLPVGLSAGETSCISFAQSLIFSLYRTMLW